MLIINDKERRRSMRLLIFVVVLLIVLAFPAYFWMKDNNHYLAQRSKAQMSPVIMIPGSSATKNRFDEMVTLLNKDTSHKHSLLKLEVYNSGKITYTGKISSGDNEPIIVVGFQNNHDGYDNIKKQAKMFDEAFSELIDQYKFNNFKAFGHSNGGLIWTLWLEKYYSDYSDYVKIKRLMTVGSPFNLNESSTSNPTQMYTYFLKHRDQLPSSLDVYSVSGADTYTEDGIVKLGSVRAGRYIYQKQVKHYTEMTVTGSKAQHSSLPQNRQIINLIEEYLLDSDQPNAVNSKNKRVSHSSSVSNP